MKPTVKTDSSITQGDGIVHNLSLESGLDLYYPLSPTGHDSLYHDPRQRSIPPTSLSHSLDFRVVGSNCDQIQGSYIT